jgi:hypothetical protein
MKNLFNDISQEEKSRILEMHSGKKNVISEQSEHGMGLLIKPDENQLEKLRKLLSKKYNCRQGITDKFDPMVKKYQEMVNYIYKKEILKVDGIFGINTANHVCPA